MTIEEAADRYRIPAQIMREYENCLCGEAREQYDQSDIERLSLIMTLHDVGFSQEETAQYMRLVLSGNDTANERSEMLRKKRNGTLEELHLKQEQLDRLDYLRYQITKPNKSK